MKLLHIIATPRQGHSNTLHVSDAFLAGLRAAHGDVEVEVVDLFNDDLPSVAGDNIEAKYTLMVGQPIDKNHGESWRRIEVLIERFLAADAYLISAPMWNFSIPYALKYYIDCIVQPGYLFRYDETGTPIGLVTGKKMLCVTSSGADYSPDGYLHAYNFHEPYLRAIFGFVGITDLQFISAQPMDIAPGLRETALASALAQTKAVLDTPGWAPAG